MHYRYLRPNENKNKFNVTEEASNIFIFVLNDIGGVSLKLIRYWIDNSWFLGHNTIREQRREHVYQLV
jgi:hypothetical protein